MARRRQIKSTRTAAKKNKRNHKPGQEERRKQLIKEKDININITLDVKDNTDSTRDLQKKFGKKKLKKNCEELAQTNPVNDVDETELNNSINPTESNKLHTHDVDESKGGTIQKNSTKSLTTLSNIVQITPKDVANDPKNYFNGMQGNMTVEKKSSSNKPVNADNVDTSKSSNVLSNNTSSSSVKTNSSNPVFKSKINSKIITNVPLEENKSVPKSITKPEQIKNKFDKIKSKSATSVTPLVGVNTAETPASSKSVINETAQLKCKCNKNPSSTNNEKPEDQEHCDICIKKSDGGNKSNSQKRYSGLDNSDLFGTPKTKKKKE